MLLLMSLCMVESVVVAVVVVDLEDSIGGTLDLPFLIPLVVVVDEKDSHSMMQLLMDDLTQFYLVVDCETMMVEEMMYSCY